MAGRSAVLRIDVLADASKASRELDGVGGRVGKLGKAVAAGAAVAAAGVATLAVASIKAASDVEQAFGATESIFGEHAEAVKRSARDAANAVGLSSSSYANLANVLGSQLKNMGTAADQLAPSTDKLIGLGADLAATFGGSTADAVAAVSSLLKGERDPIERYGVSIKAADVSARLAAQGLSGLTGQAKAQAEAQATLAILNEQTAAAQGANAREAGTLAGQQQRLSALWENAKATLGAGLLPVVTTFATFLTSSVFPAVDRVAKQLRDQLGPTFAAVGEFITTRAVPAAREFVTWFQDRIVPGIRRYLTPVLDGARDAFASVASAVQRNRPQLEQLLGVVRRVAEFMAGTVAPVIGTVVGGAFRTFGAILGGTIDTLGSVIRFIDRVVSAVRRLVEALRDSALGRGLSAIAGALSGSYAPAPGSATAGYRPAGGGLSAAGFGGGLASLVPAVQVGSPVVVVRIGERELAAVVDERVELADRVRARRLAAGVRG